MKFKSFICLAAAFIFLGQSKSFADNLLTELLKKHVYYLSDDLLKGRMTGSPEEIIAAEYIINEFEQMGVEPKGDNGSYLQAFEFVAGRENGKINKFVIDGTTLQIDKDYYLIAYSSNSAAKGNPVFVNYGIEFPEKDHNDYEKSENLKKKIFVIKIGSPEGINPHSDYYPYVDLRAKIEKAIEKGASAVIFINDDEEKLDNPDDLYDRNVKELSIPVLFLRPHNNDLITSAKKISLKTSVQHVNKTGHNVVGFIDNKQERTVVIGAHYDHLGMGESGSLHRGEPQIHNGADDNASGIASMIEIARNLKTQKENSNNYLFIAFSGEELGLYGSKSYVRNATVDLHKINYMINMDMVGRLNPDERVLGINGVGTSPDWLEAIEEIEIDSIEIKTTESGVGPSDHTSFYLENIPVVHFFTGTHSDYHKPEDDADKVNYAGLSSVTKYILELINLLNDNKKLSFVKTNDSNNENAPRFTVTLGVVPDYLFNGEGMRIDGVTEGKPAFNANIKKGDIVVGMGDLKISDMMSYMKGLSMYQKGDKVLVKVLRDNKLIDFEVQF